MKSHVAARAVSACIVLLVVSPGCKSGGRQFGDLPDIDGSVRRDAGPDAGPRPERMHDGGPGGYADAEPVDECMPSCGPEELCGMTGDGDGLDNDCDGMVDEDCPCTASGVTRACFRGPPDRRGVGSCADGVMTCTEFLTWSTCEGGQFPEDETCDGADNDCNGVPDDGLSECSTTLTCPGSELAAPLTTHLLRGSTIYTGAARSWAWTITCPATVDPCPAPADPTARDTTIYFVSSGSYRAQLDIVAEDGTELGCDWVVHVQGSGLRVELNWDTRGEGHGDTDVDLHLHRRTVPAGTMTGETAFFSDDDCYFANCKGSNYSTALRSRWSLLDTSDMSACEAAPHGQGEYWMDKGACYNPRLDVDVITCNPDITDPTDSSFCAPENINVDRPEPGSTYRIMVNYYSDHNYLGEGVVETHPSVSIYCGGELRGAFGLDPLVTLRNGDGYGESNDNWMVADVTFFEGECGRLECMVNPIGDIVRGAGFGPPWSL